MSTSVILQQMAVILILVVIGFWYERRNILSHETTKGISTIVTETTNTVMLVSSILTTTITATHQEVLIALLTAVIIYAALCVIGLLIPILIGAEKDQRKFYTMMTVYNNTGFMGLPLAKAILPENAMIYVILFNAMFSLYFYTHGVLTLGTSDGSAKINPRKMINSGTVMAVIAIIVYWFDIHPPVIITNTVTYIGNANVFLSMILLGAALARYDFHNIFRGRDIWLFILLRQILLPVGCSFLLKALRLPEDMVMAYTLMVSLPAANLPLIMAEKEDLPTDTLSRGITVTTVLSFATVTAIMSLLF